MIEVALDCSALSQLANDQATRESFIAHAMRSATRVLLPEVACIESMASSDPSRAKIRRDLIRKFLRHPKIDFRISASENDIIRVEASGGVVETPASGVIELQQLIEVEDFEIHHKRLLPTFQRHLAKELSLPLDLDVRARFPCDFPNATPTSLDMLLGNPRTDILRDGNVMFDMFVPDAGVRQRIAADPSRYPATVMATAYLSLIIYGAAFADVRFGKYAHLLVAPKRGCWVDGRTAAASAHAAVFLTEDRKLAIRVNWVANEFALGIRASTLHDWFASETDMDTS